MGFRNNGLRAAAMATLVAFAGITVQVAPVAATDPVPTATPVPTPVPTPTPAPGSSPLAVASPSTTVSGSLAVAPVTVSSTTTAPSVAQPPATAVVRPNLARRVVRIALNQRGDAYRRGAIGPRAFDCSGLVRYAYRNAGVGRRLGGGHSARAMYYWGRLHHLTSRSNPRIGDVVIYGRGSHAGIYIGNGRVISALNPRQGIRITRLHALTASFTTFIHTRLPTGG